LSIFCELDTKEGQDRLIPEETKLSGVQGDTF
jgi:hypothetical protein